MKYENRVLGIKLCKQIEELEEDLEGIKKANSAALYVGSIYSKYYTIASEKRNQYGDAALEFKNKIIDLMEQEIKHLKNHLEKL